MFYWWRFWGGILRSCVTFHPDKLFCPAGNPVNSVKLEETATLKRDVTTARVKLHVCAQQSGPSLLHLRGCGHFGSLSTHTGVFGSPWARTSVCVFIPLPWLPLSLTQHLQLIVPHSWCNHYSGKSVHMGVLSELCSSRSSQTALLKVSPDRRV